MWTGEIVGLGVYLPGEPIPVEALLNDHEPPMANSPMLKPPPYRRHVTRDIRASEMIERAARALFEELGRKPDADVILTNVLLPDNMITGAGAEAAARLGVSPATILDVHNGGCGSCPFMLDIATRMLASDGLRSVLVCNVQNTAGKVFSQPTVRHRRHALSAGDGCGVILVEGGEGSAVLATAVLHDPGSAADMGLRLDDGRLYWEPGSSELDVHFEPTQQEEIMARGNTVVPRAVRAACERAGIEVAEIDALITNQPNRVFLRNWREDLGIPADRHLDTFDELGNLYGAAAPITLARAAQAGRLADGAIVVLAGFAHAGDFAAATVLRWRSGVPAGEATGEPTAGTPR